MTLQIEELPGGAYIYYYFVCKRKLWFYANKITMEHESDLVQIGKYIELFYKEEHKYEKKVVIGNISPDVLKRHKDFVLVFEIKKSEKFKEAALWQLKYYLWYLKRLGLNVKGKLVIPEYNKEEFVELNEEDEKKIKEILREIKEIISKDSPPRETFKEYCRACAYYPLCWESY